MERWIGRVALVTGASSGFGEAIAKRLTEHGMKVVGCARNIAAIQSLSESLKGAKGSLTAIQCDVTKEDQILAMFAQIKKQFGGVDVCVNNAGLAHNAPLLTGSTEQWRHMFEVNVIGLMVCSRETVKSMKEKGVDDGHVFLISRRYVCLRSTSASFVVLIGHRVMPNVPGLHCYAATKHAVKALTEGLRNELHAANSHIRVTALSPGMAHTGFQEKLYPGDPDKVKYMLARYETMTSDDITDALVYALGAPQRVQVHDIIVRPTEA